MSVLQEHLIYDKIHTIGVPDRNDIICERKISISISEINDDLVSTTN